MTVRAQQFELEEKRRDTRRLIRDNPTLIQLTHVTWEDDGAGGVQRGEPVPEPEPVERFFQGVTDDSEFIMREAGEVVRTYFVLIGTHDDDIREDDFWTHTDGHTYKVVFVHPDQQYQTKAAVVRNA